MSANSKKMLCEITEIFDCTISKTFSSLQHNMLAIFHLLKWLNFVISEFFGYQNHF